jgi:hypothetical protein
MEAEPLPERRDRRGVGAGGPYLTLTREDAVESGTQLHAAGLPQAGREFLLLPRAWVAARSFDWATRFTRLLRTTCGRRDRWGLYYLAFAHLILRHGAEAMEAMAGNP